MEAQRGFLQTLKVKNSAQLKELETRVKKYDVETLIDSEKLVQQTIRQDELIQANTRQQEAL